jgi:hypothetical protein
MESLILHPSRRTFCSALLASPITLLAGRALASEPNPGKNKSLILLWLDGAPSQLETFDPHPGTDIAGPTGAVATTVPGVSFAEGLPQLAREMKSLCVVRSITSKEGDHERARHLMKTGARINPSVSYPCLGSIASAEIAGPQTMLPRYVSILGDDPQSRGGYLGEQHDPFRIGDPANPVPDLLSPISSDRRNHRLADAEFLEKRLAQRSPGIQQRTGHADRTHQALSMMNSPQLKAFNINEESSSLRSRYGHTPFGRGCLAARRLVQAGVRCVEVRLPGWDTHTKNFEWHRQLNEVLDPAFSALVADLRSLGLLDTTLVACMGEFGRTPAINGVGGRDHWNTGFSAVFAGAGFKPGHVHGATDPQGKPEPRDPVPVPDLFATILAALDIDHTKEFTTREGRPIKYADGAPVRSLLR